MDTTIRQPSPLLELTIDNDVIETTLGHPFWVNGHGWKMAKLLKVGDIIHAVDGAKRVQQIEAMPRPKQAFNLIVQCNANYFVGDACRVLVHDNTYRNPTPSVVPGLAKESRDLANQ